MGIVQMFAATFLPRSDIEMQSDQNEAGCEVASVAHEEEFSRF